jgi:hypothetical protein
LWKRNRINVVEGLSKQAVSALPHYAALWGWDSSSAAN